MVTCIQSSSPRIWAHFSLINSMIFLMFKVRKILVFERYPDWVDRSQSSKKMWRYSKWLGSRKDRLLWGLTRIQSIFLAIISRNSMSPLFTPKQWRAFSWPLAFPFPPGEIEVPAWDSAGYPPHWMWLLKWMSISSTCPWFPWGSLSPHSREASSLPPWTFWHAWVP